MTADCQQTSAGPRSRKFFFRGLAILLPSVLTIFLLFWAYNFVQEKIASPINFGIQELVLRATAWPAVSQDRMELHETKLNNESPEVLEQWEKDGVKNKQIMLRRDTRREVLTQTWRKYRFVLDLIGLIVAVVLIYIAGALLGSFIGRRLYRRGEELISKVPLIRQVYPFMKQVTDFVFRADSTEKLRFNKVVAVEYPRKGLWSIGLVTGDTIYVLQQKAKEPCLTVFVPSSPTPFTGYVITVPRADTIDLPITVEQALRFTVSGGVVIPPELLQNSHPPVKALGDSHGLSRPNETNMVDA